MAMQLGPHSEQYGVVSDQPALEAQPFEPREQIAAGETGERGLPTGTLTFLFTDIEGSTQLWERHPDAAHAALARHDALIEGCVARHGGMVVRPRGEGDSRFAVFHQAADAVAGAAAIQRALDAEPWTTPAPVRVRMALHTGAADLRAGDYYGSAVNRCARLRAIAHGGQTLLSLVTSALVRESLPAGLELRDLGEHRLKDLSHPEHVFQLVISGLPSDFPPLKSLDQRPNNLPIQSTPLIGREQEVAAVCERIARADVRLLTLTGPGGVGKTRLSLQAAAELLDTFEDGVYLAALSPISDPALVAATIAQTLRISESGEQSLPERLKAYLRQKQLLLVLDNFEQVLPAALLVAELLAAAPRLKILATSRAVLRVYGEQQFEVPPLALPDRRRRASAEALSQYEAIALFAARARAVKPDFHLTDENAAAVVEICRRLDGLPLAIELAAARCKLFTPQMLLAHLVSPLGLLTQGALNLPPRQRTLRAAIDWSYNLLKAGEQRLFARLGIFVGGCTLEAAEAVCNAAGDLPIDVLDGLGTLVDESLLRQITAGDGQPRFVMLETLREYARERLIASGEVETLQLRHVDYYLALAETAAPELTGPRQVDWLDRLESEHDNLRTALQWALDHDEAEISTRLGGALWRFWYTHGYLSEGRRWLEAILATVDSARASAESSVDKLVWSQARHAPSRLAAWAQALAGAGGLAWAQGEYAWARAYYQDGLSLFRELGDRGGIAYTLNSLGMVLLDQGEYARAYRSFTESLALFRELHDKRGIARALNNLGLLARDQGDYGQARRFYEGGLALFRELGDRYAAALALGNLGEVALHQRDDSQAQGFYMESLALRQELGDKEGIAFCLEGLAGAAALQKRLERAARLWGAAEALRKTLGAPMPPADRPAYDRMVAEARAQADARAWAVAWNGGSEMSLEQMLAKAATS
jgi:predicted ATPase/class 3 adenylate cyclase/Tfp pilus assembly protein PilF